MRPCVSKVKRFPLAGPLFFQGVFDMTSFEKDKEAVRLYLLENCCAWIRKQEIKKALELKSSVKRLLFALDWEILLAEDDDDPGVVMCLGENYSPPIDRGTNEYRHKTIKVPKTTAFRNQKTDLRKASYYRIHTFSAPCRFDDDEY